MYSDRQSDAACEAEARVIKRSSPSSEQVLQSASLTGGRGFESRRARPGLRDSLCLAEYAAEKLKKGDHLYVVGTLVSNVYEKEVGKGKNKAKAQITAWQIKAFSIRKLDRKESAPTAPSTAEAQPGDSPF
jgi:hypothetical protein